jgi:hypothetical protein
MNSQNITRPCIKILNTYLQNNRIPNNMKIDRIIQKMDDVFLKIKPIDHQVYLYKHIDLIYDKKKHRSQLFTYRGLYKGYLLTNLYPDPTIYNSKESQQMILKINVPKGSRCLLLDDTNVLLNRNSFISITSIQKFVINMDYQSLN